MRIALDARTMLAPRPRGIGKTLLELYRHALTIRPHWHVIAYHQSPDATLPSDFADAPIEMRCIDIPGDRFDTWERFRLPFAAWRDRADLLHCPANTCPSFFPITTVVTIHDLIPLDPYGQRSPSQRRRFAAAVEHACDRAAWVITPSTYTRDQLVSRFKAEPGRVSVLPWAPTSGISYLSPDASQPTLSRYTLKPPFALNLGAPALRKNTARLLEAWADALPQLPPDWSLVIAGLDDAFRLVVQGLVNQLGVSHRVHLLGYVHDAELSALLSAADILAFPSLAEGFGMPLFDAWATRTAVLTSDRTSLPEIAGDAALLVDPTRRASVTEGLARLTGDPRLRHDLMLAGRRQLARFNWSATAERFVEGIERIAASRPTGWRRLLPGSRQHRRAA